MSQKCREYGRIGLGAVLVHMGFQKASGKVEVEEEDFVKGLYNQYSITEATALDALKAAVSCKLLIKKGTRYTYHPEFLEEQENHKIPRVRVELPVGGWVKGVKLIDDYSFELHDYYINQTNFYDINEGGKLLFVYQDGSADIKEVVQVKGKVGELKELIKIDCWWSPGTLLDTLRNLKGLHD